MLQWELHAGERGPHVVDDGACVTARDIRADVEVVGHRLVTEHGRVRDDANIGDLAQTDVVPGGRVDQQIAPRPRPTGGCRENPRRPRRRPSALRTGCPRADRPAGSRPNDARHRASRRTVAPAGGRPPPRSWAPSAGSPPPPARSLGWRRACLGSPRPCPPGSRRSRRTRGRRRPGRCPNRMSSIRCSGYVVTRCESSSWEASTCSIDAVAWSWSADPSRLSQISRCSR